MALPSLGWMDQASCAGIDGFAELAAWKQRPVCRACPVRESYADFGMRQEVPGHSVTFGGLTGRELAAAARAAGITHTAPAAVRTEHEMRCVVCGIAFMVTNRAAKYCSRSCSWVATKARKAAAPCAV